MNIETFQRIITDNQQRDKEALTERDLEIEFIPNVAVGIVGTRRSGKTYRTFQSEYETDRKNVCRIQFNDHRIINITSDKLSLIDDAYYGIYPEKRNKETVLFIFDEIHRIKGWEDYILYLI
jgi:predicted AAA+ superfamily ATPase